MPSLQILVATRAGVAQSTVSRALANHPGIPAETRTRIQAIARQLGYAGNPLVSAVFGAMRRRQDRTNLGTFAFITAHETADGWKKIACYRAFMRGATECAAQHGFAVESHWAADPEISGERLSSIFEARGIRGLIIGSRSDASRFPQLPWEQFSLVRIGLSQRSLPLSCAVNNQVQTVREAARALAARGHRRVGLMLSHWQNEAAESNWLAGFLAWQATLPKAHRIPPHLVESFDATSVAKWQAQHRPDAVLAINADVLPLLTKGGITRRSFALLDWNGEHPDLLGMEQNNELVGRAAVDLLLNQVRRNERGFPAHPQTILIQSSWRDTRKNKDAD